MPASSVCSLPVLLSPSEALAACPGACKATFYLTELVFVSVVWLAVAVACLDGIRDTFRVEKERRVVGVVGGDFSLPLFCNTVRWFLKLWE